MQKRTVPQGGAQSKADRPRVLGDGTRRCLRRDKAHRVYEVCEIVGHVPDQIAPARGLQTQNRKITVPVIHLAKPSARHDIGERQRDNGGLKVAETK